MVQGKVRKEEKLSESYFSQNYTSFASKTIIKNHAMLNQMQRIQRGPHIPLHDSKYTHDFRIFYVIIVRCTYKHSIIT